MPRTSRNNPIFARRIEGNLNAMRELLGMPTTKGEQYSTEYLHKIIDGMVERFSNTIFLRLSLLN